jgi:hypothetical protein
MLRRRCRCSLYKEAPAAAQSLAAPLYRLLHDDGRPAVRSLLGLAPKRRHPICATAK